MVPSTTEKALAVLSAMSAAIVAPFKIVVPVEFPAVKVDPAPVASVVLLFVAKVVKAPVDRMSVPIAVLLIPVAVVLKLPDVISKLFAPVLIDEALNPERVSVPEVAVKFSAPVV